MTNEVLWPCEVGSNFDYATKLPKNIEYYGPAKWGVTSTKSGLMLAADTYYGPAKWGVTSTKGRCI